VTNVNVDMGPVQQALDRMSGVQSEATIAAADRSAAAIVAAAAITAAALRSAEQAPAADPAADVQVQLAVLGILVTVAIFVFGKGKA
jgi:hypothetical protein